MLGFYVGFVLDQLWVFVVFDCVWSGLFSDACYMFVGMWLEFVLFDFVWFCCFGFRLDNFLLCSWDLHVLNLCLDFVLTLVVGFVWDLFEHTANVYLVWSSTSRFTCFPCEVHIRLLSLVLHTISFSQTISFVIRAAFLKNDTHNPGETPYANSHAN